MREQEIEEEFKATRCGIFHPHWFSSLSMDGLDHHRISLDLLPSLSRYFESLSIFNNDKVELSSSA